MKKLAIKRVSNSIGALGALIIFGGCSNIREVSQQSHSKRDIVSTMNDDKKKTSDSLDKVMKEIYTKKAEDDINLLNKRKLVNLKKKFSDGMKSKENETSLEEIVKRIKKAGTFEKIKKISVGKIKEDYTTEATVSYSEKELVILIVYNSENEINKLSVN